MAANGNTPDKFSPEWEEGAKQLLGEGQHNPELGKRAAEDARRLVAGGLTEAEFHQKYHQAYVEEFGVDDRPIRPGEGVDRIPSESALTKQISRRMLLKLGGVALVWMLGARWLGGRALGAEAVTGDS